MKTSLLVLPALVIAFSPLAAQQKKASPHETVKETIDGNTITVVYGRPYTKHPKTGEVRKIWGELVPFGKVWRTGADEATLFTTEKTIEMGGTSIPAGTYSLFTLPDENGAKLIVNKQTGQWGTKHDAEQDLARIDMKKEALESPVDQFTIAVEKNGDSGGVLKLMWESTQYSVPFTVGK